MRKLWLLVLCCLIVPFLLYGGEKTTEIEKLVILRSPGLDPAVESAVAKFTDEFGIEVEVIEADISTGSTITIDTMIAAGEAPDIYMDYLARTGKFIDPAYAIALDDYVDMSAFSESMMGQFKRNGKYHAIMRPTGAQGMFVNLDVLAEAGISESDIPEDWTVADFVAMARELKKIGKYATILFAANQSGDYFYMNYFASFGAQLYSEGYTESTADSPEGLATLQFLNMLVEEGYAPRESAVYTDDDYLRELGMGNCAVGGLFIGHLNVLSSMVEQGAIDAMPNYKFISFPNGAAACSMPHAVVGHDSGDDFRNEMVATLMTYIESKESQEHHVVNYGTYSPRTDVTAEPDSEDWQAIKKIVEQNGLYDLGLAHPAFGEIRKQMFPLLQEMYAGKLSPEDAIKMYDENVTAILQDD